MAAQDTRNKRGVTRALVLACMLIASSFFVSVAMPKEVSAYTLHNPIYINGNANFTAANGVTGGNGTPSNPYVIEGWQISSTTANCIEIRNTDAYFMIRQVSILQGPSSSNALYGIYLYTVANARVENVTAANGYYAISVDSSNGVTIANSNVSSSYDGLYVLGSNDVTVVNTSASGNTDRGIYVVSSKNSAVARSAVSSAQEGIEVRSSTDTNVSGNIVWDNIEGIRIESSGNISINGNNASSNFGVGIFVYRSAEVFVSKNIASSNAGDGVGVWSSNKTSVIGNLASSNTNSGIHVTGAINTTLANNTVSGNKDGILTDGSTDTVVDNNTAYSNTENGISMSGSLVNTDLTHNTATRNRRYGFYIVGAFSTRLIGNIASNNEGDPDYGFGIYLAGTDSEIRGNVASGNPLDGIAIGTASNTLISENTVSLNGLYGIHLFSSTGGQTYHNDFVQNRKQAGDDLGSENSWDDGYPSGGNYWSNYTGVDNCSGPLQDNCTGPDGIGDTPVIIDSDSKDQYPLMQPYNGTSPPLSNTPPIASFTVTPNTGDSSTIFTVDASFSSDAQDPTSALQIRWDWENDGVWDTAYSTTKTATHQYSTLGTYTIKLEVIDTGGLTDNTTRQVVVAPHPLTGWTILSAVKTPLLSIITIRLAPEVVQAVKKLSGLWPTNASELLQQVTDGVNDPANRTQNQFYQVAYEIINSAIESMVGISPDTAWSIYLAMGAWKLCISANLGLGVAQDGSMDFQWEPQMIGVVMSHADVLVTDSIGRMTGSVWQGGSFARDVSDIPGSVYSGHDSYPASLLLPPNTTVSKIQVFGISSGDYHLVYAGMGAQGNFIARYNRTIAQGETDTFSIPPQMSGDISLQAPQVTTNGMPAWELGLFLATGVVVVAVVLVAIRRRRTRKKT